MNLHNNSFIVPYKYEILEKDILVQCFKAVRTVMTKKLKTAVRLFCNTFTPDTYVFFLYKYMANK